MIYFIQREFRDLIKIGFSTCTVKRMHSLKSVVSRGEQLRLLAEIPGGYDLEQQLHRQFNGCRYPGSFEWFRPSPELLKYIADLPKAAGK